MLILPAMRQLRAVRLLCTVFTLLSAPNSRVAATAFPRPHPSMIRAPLPVVGSQKKFWAQEVPGDGACLFHTIAAAVRYQEKGEHSNFDQSLYNLSHQLRQLACDTLACENVPLYLGEQEESTTTDILNMIAKQYNTTGPGYCELMRQPREWGGGPEIVALSNVLRQPVHVYELYTRRFFPTRFLLRPAARFGSPKFDSNAKEPLCILCADGRFPGIPPGSQKSTGDHFMPLFEATSSGCISTKSMIRGGIDHVANILKRFVFYTIGFRIDATSDHQSNLTRPSKWAG